MHDHYLFGRFESTEAGLDGSDIERICAVARAAQGRLEEIPLSRLLDVLDAVARRWRDPAYPGRRKALEHMPSVVGFHPSMVERALDALSDVMRRPTMEKKIRLELGHRDVLDGWRYLAPYQGFLRAQALGVVLHVSAGNVFVSGADSLVHGLVTRNAGLLKVSRADPLFPLLFARSLQEVDESGVLAGAIAILSFRGGDAEVEAALKRRVDAVAVWGGESAVQSWRRDLPMRVRLLGYGPKYSFSVLTSGALAASNLDAVCEAAALDVALWEQRACSSPQVIYVEASDGGALIEEFVNGLCRALDDLRGTLPPGRRSLDEQVEILRHRELARMAQAFGEAVLRVSENAPDWTVIVRRDVSLETSPGNRVVIVKPYEEFEDVLREVERHRGSIQTVGLLGLSGELTAMATALVRAGADRITEIGKMGVGQIGSPHDGTWQLHDLVRWACMESMGSGDGRPETVDRSFDIGRRIAPALDSKSPTKWARLQELLAFARQHSPFYAERLKGRTFEEYVEFEQVPFLDRRDVYLNTPPQGEGLLTGPLEQAYVFASGGSTGEPKFSFYGYDEFSEVTTILAEIYQVAGISSRDTVGNLFMAGNLWTSFIVANEALEKIGCVTLPIAGNAEMDLVVRYLRLFRPSALIGLPSIIIQLAEMVKERGLDIRVHTVLYGGEHMSGEARTFLRQALGCERIVSAGYASVDAGPVGYQCSHAEGSVHHLLYDYQFLEIVDSETGEALPKGETGEIVVTNLDRRLMPIVRYRTGDLGRRIEGTCQCGRLGPRFELLGRCDDVIRVGSVSIYPESIEAVLGGVSEISRLFQIVADREGAKDRLVVRTESAHPVNGDLERRLERLILDDHQELAEAIREGWLGAFKVEVLPTGGIPRVRRTGKIRKVIDLRV
jgi:phenylacetate-coenzyme A ligase PaaK-like adenylate-forming protein